MPTEKPRVTITMTEDELSQINDYRFEYKMKNQTQAILSLVEKGFTALQCSTQKITTPISIDDLTIEENSHIKKYRALADEGRGRVDNVLDYEFGLVSEAKTPANSA